MELLNATGRRWRFPKPRLEDEGLKTDVRGRKTDDRSQISEDRSQMTEGEKVGRERRSAALQERPAALKSASLEGKNRWEGESGLFCYQKKKGNGFYFNLLNRQDLLD